ncbi:Bcr/CflA family multidrug efflux MFS transporter [Metabacillus rhizolycopersici]|uniref:Bcr/CflA family efflux transporter n=1 Tax=Metabacillus rhizolycopersici TaxID=2875709 RepID=A0ABS7UM29_9BACI|nr:Bcr/CflA family multidrug efflux MFS transporter [Metabacillus rhizolycopersici]MBZ5748990.1 Bcr/CflA family multidrug efflux MFS transporter [Metabacillus rhizolycopersici]
MNIEQKQNVKQQRKAFIALILGTLAAFGPLSIDMYLPSFPILAAEFSTSASMVQLSLTFFLLGACLGQLVTGPLSDVLGRRKPLLYGMILYVFTSIIISFTQTMEMFIFLRFIQGLAGAAGMVISRAVVRDLYSGSEMTKFFSLLALVNGMAPILAPIVGAQLLKWFPWQSIFFGLAIIGIIAFLLVFFGLSETLHQRDRSTGGLTNTIKTFGQLVTNHQFMGYVLSNGFIFATMFAYISGSSFVIQHVYGASTDTYSMIFAMNGIGIMIASQLTGRLAGRINEKTLLFAGILMSLIGGSTLLLLIYLNVKLAFIIPPLFLTVSSVGIVGTTSNSLALQNNRNVAGSASALLGVTNFIVGAIAAPIVGIAGEDTAVPMGIVMVVSSIGAILSYKILVRKVTIIEHN